MIESSILKWVSEIQVPDLKLHSKFKIQHSKLFILPPKQTACNDTHHSFLPSVAGQAECVRPMPIANNSAKNYQSSLQLLSTFSESVHRRLSPSRSLRPQLLRSMSLRDTRALPTGGTKWIVRQQPIRRWWQ